MADPKNPRDQGRANNPWDDELKRKPAEVNAPEESLARGATPMEVDDRRAGTTGAFAPPDSTPERDRAARLRMAGAYGGPGQGRTTTGDSLPTMVSGFQRQGSQRGSTAGIPEEALPLADKGQGRD